MNEPVWVGYNVVLAIHEEQLAEHGGSDGIRDYGLLESALARPQNLSHYSPDVTLSELATVYAAGITRNHAFIDGNKRTAWVTCAAFLRLNGSAAMFDQAKVVEMVLGLSASTVTEQQFAAWLEE